MHTYLEKYVGNTGHLDLTDTGRVAKPMAETVIKEGLNGKLSEIWGTEITLYYPGLYPLSPNVLYFLHISLNRYALLSLFQLLDS